MDLLGLIRRRVTSPYIAYDTFTRGDNNTTMGSTEEGTAGILAWTPQLNNNGGAANVWGITSNTAYSVSAGGGSWTHTIVAAGAADAYVEVTVSTIDSANGAGLAFRSTDYQNYLFAWYLASGFVDVYKSVNGALTQILHANVGGAPANGDVLKAKLNGSSIEMFLNGASAGSTTETARQTATKHGISIFNHSATARWNNFKVTAL